MADNSSVRMTATYLDLGHKPDAMSVALMVAGALSGAIGLAFVFYMLFTEGHAAFNTSSDIAWGAPIAFYPFFLLTSSGLSIIAALDTVFGMMAMRPAWYSPIMPMYFILTGFVSALAFAMFITSLIWRTQEMPKIERDLYDVVLPRLFFVMLLAVIGMRFGQIVTGLWSNFEGMEAHWRMLSSPLFHIEIWIGMVLPMLLMSTNAMRRNVGLQLLTSVLFMIGIFFARLELLIVGQEVPLFKGYWTGYVDYWPSITGWMLVPAGFGIFFFLYGAGSWLLRLSEAEAPSEAH
jgi:molybdopterin-containing oxidoreductase family membrane subunit